MIRGARALSLAAALGLAGCGAAAPKGEALMESVQTYNDGVRWERLAAAASRVPAAEREEFVDDRDELAKDLKITDWEVQQVHPDGDGKARVHVKYSWYRQDEGVVKETIAIQRWERRGKAWLIVDERRARGDEMPGLAEPDPETPEEGPAGAPADGADPDGGGEPRADLR